MTLTIDLIPFWLSLGVEAAAAKDPSPRKSGPSSHFVIWAASRKVNGRTRIATEMDDVSLGVGIFDRLSSIPRQVFGHGRLQPRAVRAPVESKQGEVILETERSNPREYEDGKGKEAQLKGKRKKKKKLVFPGRSCTLVLLTRDYVLLGQRQLCAVLIKGRPVPIYMGGSYAHALLPKDTHTLVTASIVIFFLFLLMLTVKSSYHVIFFVSNLDIR